MAMHALDRQIAREMLRTPAELEEHGVQKWEPIASRIENVASWVLTSIGDKEIELDSLLVLAQAMTKSLQLLAEDLGEDGLGKLRSSYCRAAFEAVRKDADRGLKHLTGERDLV